ncbi:hypothetical protein FZEAL_4145 [Fusarium zealandicum]|uniref:PD-(D/E)XK nuclease-like domain-containing protein n=1 Tax=Fusarium zealandicum TaxID=1053134 RepID=A0A8H4XL38_9HYPO|nr:hypothetical protein FZEAL_4145 [Fusarium zealandicum]
MASPAIPLHRHQSSLEGIIDFSLRETLSKAHRVSALRRFYQVINYFDSNDNKRGPDQYDRVKLVRLTYEYSISQVSKDNVLIAAFDFLKLSISSEEDINFEDVTYRLEMQSHLYEFADYLIDNFFLPLKASTKKTPQPTPSSHSAVAKTQRQGHVFSGTPERLASLRGACLIRDRHRCVISRKFDKAEALKRFQHDGSKAVDQDGVPLADPEQRFDYLEVAHVLPHSLTQLNSSKELDSSKVAALAILNMFDSGVAHLIEGVDIDRTFLPPGLAEDVPVTRALFLTEDKSIDPPSPRLLAVHRAIAHILHLSAAGDYIDDILRDVGEFGIRSDGSTDLSRLLKLRLGWAVGEVHGDAINSIDTVIAIITITIISTNINSQSSMGRLVIEAWLSDIPDTAIHRDQEPEASRKRKRDDADTSGPLISPMSSSSKRLATEPLDLESTPQSLTDIRYQHLLRRDIAFNPPSSRRSSPSPSKRRRRSPSKRHTTTASLKLLDPPIHVVNPPDLTAALPADVQPLFDELYMVIEKQAILPPNLKRIMGADAIKHARVLPSMWQGNDDPEQDEELRQQHTQIQNILAEAAEATTMTKGESAWNAQVHYPILKLALSSISSTRAETITNAQIIKDFRPRSRDQGWSSVSSSAASSQSSILSDDTGTWAEPESSVHKMVDFALVLIPDDTLEGKIKGFLTKQQNPTINHTMYDALSQRPAPVFIETKTSAGVVDRSHVQLGIWTAAWFQRLRAVKSTKGPIAVPVIQVHGNVWTAMFAVDGKDKILLLDQSVRIGDTATLLGLYQLLSALRVIGKWINTTFQTWLGEFLDGVPAG